MTLPDLIDINRAKLNSTLASLALPQLDALLNAAQGAVRDYTQNGISLGTYTQYSSGGIYIREPLLLRHDPVVQITRIATNPLSALQVQNTDQINNQRATIATDDPGTGLIGNVILYWVASAVASQQSLAVTTYPTLAQMATAINAVGHGWAASVMSAPTINFNQYPSSDLRPLQGAVTTISGSPAYLSAWVEDVSPFGSTPWFDDFYGLDSFQGQSGWRLDSETGELYGRFPRGQLNIRVDYTAGYATVPDQVQEAVVQTMIWLYRTENLNFSVESQRLGDASTTFRQHLDLPASIKRLLAPFSRARSRAFYR